MLVDNGANINGVNAKQKTALLLSLDKGKNGKVAKSS